MPYRPGAGTSWTSRPAARASGSKSRSLERQRSCDGLDIGFGR